MTIKNVIRRYESSEKIEADNKLFRDQFSYK
jgi:hypothetical protein